MPDAAPSAPRWGFIGAGKMATALIRGMLRAGESGAATILASDPVEAARVALADETGIPVYDSNVRVAHKSDVLVLATKPQSLPHVLAQLRPVLTPEHLVVSIAAGVSLATLAEGLGSERRLARVMPNTPALVGEGAAGYCLGPHALDSDEAPVRSCLEGVGRAYRVPESMLDAVTGLSGSGPAFVYVIIEALSDGGVRVGLPRDVATTLAVQTTLGTAKMLSGTGEHPARLKDMVTSPGGTTIAGIHAMERAGVRAAMIDAIVEATERSRQLGAS